MKNLKIKRVYHPYYKWECLPMYLNKINIKKETAEKEYAKFLRNSFLFKKTIDKVFTEWSCSCEHFLTNDRINRVAWIGQSAMCMYSGIPQFYKSGFKLLSEKEAKKANTIAKEQLIKWLRSYEE